MDVHGMRRMVQQAPHMDGDLRVVAVQDNGRRADALHPVVGDRQQQRIGERVALILLRRGMVAGVGGRHGHTERHYQGGDRGGNQELPHQNTPPSERAHAATIRAAARAVRSPWQTTTGRLRSPSRASTRHSTHRPVRIGLWLRFLSFARRAPVPRPPGAGAGAGPRRQRRRRGRASPVRTSAMPGRLSRTSPVRLSSAGWRT